MDRKTTNYGGIRIEQMDRLFTVAFTAKISNEEYGAFLNHFLPVYRAEMHFVVLYNLSLESLDFSLARRKATADALKRDKDNARRFNVAAAAVVPNVMARKMIDAVFMVAPPPTPLKTAETVLDGYDWLARKAAEAGFPLDPQVRSAIRAQTIT